MTNRECPTSPLRGHSVVRHAKGVTVVGSGYMYVVHTVAEGLGGEWWDTQTGAEPSVESDSPLSTRSRSSRSGQQMGCEGTSLRTGRTRWPILVLQKTTRRP